MIPLYVDNGVAQVWNSDVWYHLRSEYRICGSLIGSIATYPRQNEFLGLPMSLTTEEVALLVEKGICNLFSLPKLKEKPTDKEREEFNILKQRVAEEQTEALRKRKIEQISQKIDIIVAGKKQKLLSKGVKDIQLDKQTLLQEEINKLPKLSPAYLLEHIPTEHQSITEKQHVSIFELKPSIVNKQGELRYLVFKDLWEKGFCITGGSKFGCDYLVYPGDPARFHAMYMVRCIENTNQDFHPSKIVAFGRLSVSVNKLAVFAFRDSNGVIDYQTLQWHDSANM